MSSEKPEQGLANNKNSLLDSFLTHRKQLLRLIGRFVRPDEIEDIVQETFVQSFAAARNQQIHNPQAFMFRTARNLAINCVSRFDRKYNLSLEDMDESSFASETNIVEEQCQSEERFLCFCRAVSSLPVNCRKVFILKKVYGLSQNEIADFLGMPSSTVEKHIARGMTATLAYMRSTGHTDLVRTSKRATPTFHDKEKTF